MTETLPAYWQYLKNPRLLRLSSDKTSVWKEILWLLLLDFAFAAIVLICYYSLLKFNLIKKYPEYDLFEFGFAWGLLLGAILAPLIEECLFRWHLRKPKFSVWFVMGSLLLIVNYSTTDDYIKFFAFIFILVAGLLAYITYEKLSRSNTVKAFRAYYVFLFYYTALLFGYVHIFNVKGLTLADPSFIIYTSSQVVGGRSMGYIRVKYGLIYSILLHAIFNLVAITAVWFLR